MTSSVSCVKTELGIKSLLVTKALSTHCLYPESEMSGVKQQAVDAKSTLVTGACGAEDPLWQSWCWLNENELNSLCVCLSVFTLTRNWLDFYFRPPACLSWWETKPPSVLLTLWGSYTVPRNWGGGALGQRVLIHTGYTGLLSGHRSHFGQEALMLQSQHPDRHCVPVSCAMRDVLSGFCPLPSAAWRLSPNPQGPGL